MFTRNPQNPLIKPTQIAASRPDWEVIGVFNPGVAQVGDETLLLVRVAERPAQTDRAWIACPTVDERGEVILHRVRRDDPAWDTRDPRIVRHRHSGAVYLTSLSHIRRARSHDGIHFTVEAGPWLFPQSPLEAFGVEDMRVTPLDDAWLLNYSAVSGHGIATALATTRDFEHIERLGIGFPPSNRDVTVFPRRIGGQYAAYHRPMPGEFGRYSIWLATSPDLLRWGDHRPVLEGQGGWEAGRVGGGAPPLWMPEGWLVIYHAADAQQRYCLGAFLAAHDDPSRILARCPLPILSPEKDYETEGFFGKVVFTCGALLRDGVVRVYYGASDETIALAEAPLNAILESLREGAGVR